MVYSTRRFVLCLTLCHFILVFSSPFSIAITSLGEERANFSAFHTFVRFALVWFYLIPLPLGVWEGLRFVIVALPGLFSYLLFYIFVKRKTLENIAINKKYLNESTAWGRTVMNYLRGGGGEASNELLAGGGGRGGEGEGLSWLYGIPTLALSFNSGKTFICLVRVEVFKFIRKSLRVINQQINHK